MIAIVAATLGLLDPVDQFSWLFQSKFGGQKPSGDIVFLSANENLDDPRLGHRRVELARALDELERRGVGKVYLDIAFEQLSDPKYDRPLAQAIADLGPRIAIADQLAFDSRGTRTLQRTNPLLAGSAARIVADKQNPFYFGIKWSSAYSVDFNGRRYQTLGAALGGARPGEAGEFAIDYGFNGAQISTLSLDKLIAPGCCSRSVPDLAGKTVVIGYDRQTSETGFNIPNGIASPPSFIPIYAGETLKSGRTGFVSGYIVVTLIAALLALLIALDTSRRRRWFGYAGIVAVLPFALLLGARLGVRIEASYAMTLCLSYAIFRSRMRWKLRVALVNQETGIATLRALENNLARDRITGGHVVIAKIHNYERVLKTLRSVERGDYTVRIVERLRATDPGLAIYADGHHIGWYAPTEETPHLIEHLEGMRAIFAAPVQVGELSIDVDITFGLAAISGDPAGRIVAAVAAAEETSEAHEPIKAAESADHSDLLWDISLRARIDEAMENGEIYCVYQPQIETVTGRIVGVEALVRWHDPARGFIQPMHFIQQCEKAGRMEHLTRYVLQSACSAGKLLHFRGRLLRMSVNISATMLGDMRIVGIVRNILQATRFDPAYLVLEVTETSRIADLKTAATILKELRSLGLKISMDDFGVGAANFEALYELPFDEVKIDRLFVANLSRDPKARAIANSIVAMGREARITVVAEGVETLQDVAILNKIGCEELQGYYFSRPISLSNLLEFNDIAPDGRIANMV